MKWKNESSFSQSDKDRTPNCWVAKAGCFKLTVHRHIHHSPTAWLLSCDGVRLECRELAATDIDAAKQEAIEIVYKRLIDSVEAMGA